MDGWSNFALSIARFNTARVVITHPCTHQHTYHSPIHIISLFTHNHHAHTPMGVLVVTGAALGCLFTLGGAALGCFPTLGVFVIGGAASSCFSIIYFKLALLYILWVFFVVGGGRPLNFPPPSYRHPRFIKNLLMRTCEDVGRTCL